MTDPSTPVLTNLLQNLIRALGSLPSAKFDNFAEWDELAPPIIQASEAISMALRERAPDIAIDLRDVAANCAAIREAMKVDEKNPPTSQRIKHRDQQILEMQATVMRALEQVR